MEHPNRHDGIDADVVRLAAKHARHLARQTGFEESDIDDIQQELILAALDGLLGYDPARGKKTTYLWSILERTANQLFRNRTRQRRSPTMEAFSLDEVALDADEPGLLYGDIIADPRDRGRPQRDLAMDVREAIESLEPDLRALALLHSELRPTEAREAAGLAKSTHHRAMRRIREHFERLGVYPPGTF